MIVVQVPALSHWMSTEVALQPDLSHRTLLGLWEGGGDEGEVQNGPMQLQAIRWLGSVTRASPSCSFSGGLRSTLEYVPTLWLSIALYWLPGEDGHHSHLEDPGARQSRFVLFWQDGDVGMLAMFLFYSQRTWSPENVGDLTRPTGSSGGKQTGWLLAARSAAAWGHVRPALSERGTQSSVCLS